MSKVPLFIAFGISMFLFRCGNPVSWETVVEPKNIRPEIVLTKNLNNLTGNQNIKIKVELNNTNGESIGIENGYVKVNGRRMNDPNLGIGSTAPAYYFATLPIERDSLYTFDISFSDGQSYYAWIITPDIDLVQMELPDRVKRKNSFNVSWIETDYRYPQDLFVQYFQQGDGFTSKNQERIRIHYPYKGIVSINKNFVRYTDNDDFVTAESRIILSASTNGALDEQFSSGGTIECRFNIYHDIEVY